MKNTEIFIGTVIKNEKIGEADMRITLLCTDGVRVFTLTGAQKPAAKLKSAAQLLTTAEFTVSGHSVIGAYVLQSYPNIVKDIKRYYLACAICEIVLKVFKGMTEDCDTGFLLTVKALEKLNSETANLKEVFTKYFTELLQSLGYDVEPNQDINTAYLQNLDISIPNTRFFLT